MSEKLKSCPFCGGEALVSVDADGVVDAEGRKWSYTVVCNECASSSGLCFSSERAIEAWNTRKPIEKIVEQLEKRKMVESEKNECDVELDSYVSCAFDKAIEIVKGE